MSEFVRTEASQKKNYNNQNSHWELWERRAHGLCEIWTVVVAVRAASRHVLHGQGENMFAVLLRAVLVQALMVVLLDQVGVV